MGSVWKAHRSDGLYQGVVAIKFVHAAWIGRTGEQRFRIEGNLLGRLDHPNIARLIDAGVLVGTQPYLILEYIEGEPIDAYCEREKLGLESRINLFLGVLAAVAHAHSILRKALKKEPGERYASVGAFADDLKRFLTHEPVRARADTIRIAYQSLCAAIGAVF